MRRIIILIFISVLFLTQLNGQVVKVHSPNKTLVFNLRVKHKKASYSIIYKNKSVVENSPFSLNFETFNFDTLSVVNTIYNKGVEEYDLVLGKTKHVKLEYQEAIISLKSSGENRKLNIQIRAFNDGIAFRYVVQKSDTTSTLTLYNENTNFKLTSDPLVHALLLPNYTSSHEGVYTTKPLSQITEDTLMDMPVLFETNGTFVAITEAALLDYPGMYLSKHAGTIVSKLSPLPGQQLMKAHLPLPYKSPWRVLLISDRVGDLLESNIITSLNEPCAIKDVSWIHPGKTTFPWWNGNVLPDTINAPGNNFITQKYYIDFCKRNHIEYHSVVEYGLHQWYTDDGINFQPGPHPDVTKPVPGLDMQQVCDYAKSVGVGIRVWVHWAALYPKIDSAFAIFEKWGIAGMMIDFMDRDDQQMVNIQTEMLQKAAAHHLHIQFHGAYKNTGLSRTYPNEYTREGTRNYEVDKWDDKGLPADHDIMIPFTRMLAGSTDYHLGGFRAVVQDSFRAQYTRPLVLSTRCHMLAMYVVLENYLQMVCDYPAAYEGEPGFDFIKEIPTTWDEIKVLDAKVGEYIIIARRKNDTWYIGAITNHNSRKLSVPLNFLSEGNYTAEIYSDAVDSDKNPNHLKKEVKGVHQKEVIELSLASNGGEVICLKPVIH